MDKHLMQTQAQTMGGVGNRLSLYRVWAMRTRTGTLSSCIVDCPPGVAGLADHFANHRTIETTLRHPVFTFAHIHCTVAT